MDCDGCVAAAAVAAAKAAAIPQPSITPSSQSAAQGLMTLATLTDLDSKISPTSKCLLCIAVYFVEAVIPGETKSLAFDPSLES